LGNQTLHRRLNASCDVSIKTTLTTDPSEAAEHVRAGRLAVFPTETVYGLGADALNADAVRSIFQAKGRPSDNPLIVHLARRDQVRSVAADCPPAAERLLDRFAPGPITVILRKTARVPGVVTAGLNTVGVRLPAHPVAQAFLEACDTPVAAPSANRSGRPSPTTWQAARSDLDGRVHCILQGGRTDAGLESTVVDCTTDPPVMLRPGAVPLEALRDADPRVRAAASGSDEEARSPGTRHRHYAPDARVVIVDGPSEAVPGPEASYVGLDAPDEDAFSLVHVADSVEAYGRELFHFLRESDAHGCQTVYAQRVPEEGMGTALMDRLRRAAQR
jgi:L-threonylcarbamoyladenylate synthase